MFDTYANLKIGSKTINVMDTSGNEHCCSCNIEPNHLKHTIVVTVLDDKANPSIVDKPANIASSASVSELSSSETLSTGMENFSH